MPRRRLLPILLCMLSLTSCNGYFGGADDDGGDGGGNSDAQGIWNGTLTSSQMFVSMLATPANDLWAISWNDTFNQVGQLTRGTGALNGSVYSGTGKTFTPDQTGVSSAALSGNITTGSSFDGDLGQNVTFTTTFVNTYSQAYDASAFAGTWQGRDNIGAGQITAKVDAGGNLSVSTTISGQTTACTANGSLRNPGNGRNYAIASFSFGGPSVCPTGGMQGVAYVVTSSGGKPTMLIAGTNNDQTTAWFAFVQKPAPAASGGDDGTDDTETDTEDDNTPST